MVKTWNRAIINFKKGGIKDIMNGMKNMLILIEQVPLELGSCKGVQGAVAHLMAKTAGILSPGTFVKIAGKNLVFQSPKIIRYVRKGVASHNKGDNYRFGLYIGQALAVLTN